MKIVIGAFGEKIPYYETREEERAALDNFLAMRYGALTAAEIMYFRECLEDPDGTKWETRHAGELLRITQEEVEEALFVHRPCGETWEQSWAWLRAAIGPHPISPLTLWAALRGIALWPTSR